MAKTGKEAASAATVTAAPPNAPESQYAVAELAKKAGQLFHTSPECVTTALTLAGIQTATVNQARAVVDKFLKQEVK